MTANNNNMQIIKSLVTYKDVIELVSSIVKGSLTNADATMFCFQDKAAFKGMVGKLATTKADVLNYSKQDYTHFTPNAYRMRHKMGVQSRPVQVGKDGKVIGHTYQNLHAINALVIDFDAQGVITSPDVILDYCAANGIPKPTYILKTDKQDGYQAGYVLDSSFVMPLEWAQHDDAIEQIKDIHTELKKAFNKLQPDEACNAIGFFRLPNLSNTKAFTRKYYDFSALKRWAKLKKSQLEVITNDNPTPVREHGAYNKYDKSVITRYNLNLEWFQLLINCRNVPHGLRNKSVFTMALAYKQAKVSLSDAMQALIRWNNRNASPLAQDEVVKSVTSAYVRHYHGPAIEHIKIIMNGVFKDKDVKVYSCTFVKHKKDRQDRVRSHAHEREEDLVKYLMQCYKDGRMDEKGFLKITTRELIIESSIPKTALFKLLKQSKHIQYSSNGKGRYAYILITCTDVLEAIINDMDIVSTEFVQDVLSYPKDVQDILLNALEYKGYNVLQAFNINGLWGEYG